MDAKYHDLFDSCPFYENLPCHHLPNPLDNLTVLCMWTSSHTLLDIHLPKTKNNEEFDSFQETN